MGRDEMRAADADRQATAEQLRIALEEGRLDLPEYDERLQRAYAAKTYGELQPLLGDLPSATVPAAAGSPGVSDAQVARRWVLQVWSSWVPVVGITTAIWLISCLGAGELLYFWPGWVAGPWGVVLVGTTVAGLAAGEPRKQAAKRARKQQVKVLKRERRALAADATAPGEVGLPVPKTDKKAG